MAIQYRSGTTYRNLFQYNGNIGRPTQQFTAKARIQKVITKTVSSRARICIVQTFSARARIYIVQTFSARARLSKFSLYLLSSKAWIKAPQRFTAHARILQYQIQIFSSHARVSRRQGWPIPDISDPDFSLWQDTRIYSRVKMSNYIAFPIQILRLKGRVTYSKTLGMQSRARVVTAQILQMRANILPKFFTVHLPTTFQVQQTSQRKLRVVFLYRGSDT